MEIDRLAQDAEALKDSAWKLLAGRDAGLLSTNAHLALQHFIDRLLARLDEQERRIAALEGRQPS